MSELLNPDVALQQLLTHIPAPTVMNIPIEEAYSRVLAEPVVATLDLPPFDNAAMDGYAVISADVERSPTQLDVVQDIPAGATSPQPLQPGQAARIMTGAPLPAGADAVIPVEQTDQTWHRDATQPLAPTVTIRTPAAPGVNIRPTGQNIQQGQPILEAGTPLRPQDIGMIASLGLSQVRVFASPTVAILGSGDELAPVGDQLKPGQIYDSNSYTVAALVQANGGIPVRYNPAADTLEAVRAQFRDALQQKPDLIVSTAGVSVGAFDVVRSVLDELGEIDFWRVNVRPGKPLAFGQVKGVPFFGLPGNPVSAMVTFDLFVRPAMRKLLGLQTNPPTQTAVTEEEITSDGRRTYVRVTLRRQGAELMASVTGTQSSGALMSMVLADGLLIVPEGQTEVAAGTRLPVRLLQPV